MRAWLWAPARRRRRALRSDTLWDRRRQMVRELAPGKSFVDLGGMWGVNGELAFIAEAAGATDVVLFDGMDPTEEFQAEHEQRGSRVRYVQGDLHDTEGLEALGAFDIVWCAGILYHTPNPYLQLENLRLITRERLLLGTALIPEVPGIEQACVFYPGISEGSRREYARVYGDAAPCFLGASAPFDYTPLMGYANFWWGITPSALRAMLEVARFKVMDEFMSGPFFVDALCEPVAGESVIPPTSFSRKRGEERRARFDDDSRPGWA